MLYLRRLLPWILSFSVLLAIPVIGDFYFDGQAHVSEGIIGSRPVLTAPVTDNMEILQPANFMLLIDGVQVDRNSYEYSIVTGMFRCALPFTLEPGRREIELRVQAVYGSAVKTVFANVAETRGVTGELILFPSPATDNINVSYELKSAQNASLMIYNLNGQMVLRRDFNMNQPGGSAGYNQVNIELRGYGGRVLGNGVYIAVLRSGNSAPLRTRFIILR